MVSICYCDVLLNLLLLLLYIRPITTIADGERWESGIPRVVYIIGTFQHAKLRISEFVKYYYFISHLT